MRTLVLTVFSVIILLSAFLIGRITNDQEAGSGDDNLALVNNSLINRFNKPEEKAAKPAGVFKITAEDGRWLKLAPTGREISYYLPKTGQIRSVAIAPAGGQAETIAQLKPNLKKIFWSSNGKELIADDGASLIHYNLPDGKSRVLNGKIRNPVFAPGESKIAYLFFDDTEGGGQIRVGSPTGEIFKNILSTRLDNWQITWVNDQILGLTANGSFFILDINSGALQKILADKTNLEILLSPDGRKLVFSSGAAPGAIFNFSDLAAGAETKVAENYRANNCIWSVDNKNLYCLAGKTLSVIDTGAALPALKTIYTDPTLVEAVEPRLNGAEDYLVFRDSWLGRIFGLHLK
ncbi:MAG: hypothetical protein AAB566_02495 [Patescibacteria group bacterium]